MNKDDVEAFETWAQYMLDDDMNWSESGGVDLARDSWRAAIEYARSGEASVYIFPSALDRLEKSEGPESVFSVACSSPSEKTVPLFTHSQPAVEVNEQLLHVARGAAYIGLHNDIEGPCKCSLCELVREAKAAIAAAEKIKMGCV